MKTSSYSLIIFESVGMGYVLLLGIGPYFNLQRSNETVIGGVFHAFVGPKIRILEVHTQYSNDKNLSVDVD